MFQLRVRGLEPDWRLVRFRPNVRLTELDFRVNQAYYVNIPRQNLSTVFQARVRGLEFDWRLVWFRPNVRLTELDFRVNQAYYVNIPRKNLSTAFQARVRGLESDWRLVRFCSNKQLTELDIRVNQAYYVNIPRLAYTYNRNKLELEELPRVRRTNSEDYDVHDEGSTCSILRVKQVLGG